MKRFIFCLAVFGMISVMAGQADALITSVFGPPSSAGTAPMIIPPPTHVLDDFVTNTGMQGFNEAQGVVTTVPYLIDGGGIIPPGTLVNSHMIFLNSELGPFVILAHTSVVWIFENPILGVMSDYNGSLEAASTLELGVPTTFYPTPSPGLGRGLEGQDGYVLLSPYTLLVNMYAAEPGDWIRVVTVIPAPGAILLGSIGIGLISWLRRRRTL